MEGPFDRHSLLTGAASVAMLAALPAFARTLPQGIVDIRDFGARGGGTVYVPPGTYASYTVHLKSNISLWLDRGATDPTGRSRGRAASDAILGTVAGIGRRAGRRAGARGRVGA